MGIKKYYAMILLTFVSITQAEPLSPDKAYYFVSKIEKNSIMIYGTMQPEYKLYKNNIKIINNKSSIQLGSLIKPAGKRQYNEFLNKYQEEYEGDLLMEIPILESKKGIIDFDLEAQGCTKGLCYSPFTTHIKLIKN